MRAVANAFCNSQSQLAHISVTVVRRIGSWGTSEGLPHVIKQPASHPRQKSVSEQANFQVTFW